MNKQEYNSLEKKKWYHKTKLYSESRNISFDDPETLLAYCYEYGCYPDDLMLVFYENDKKYSAIVDMNTYIKFMPKKKRKKTSGTGLLTIYILLILFLLASRIVYLHGEEIISNDDEINAAEEPVHQD
ncbi:hypothetical protein [uncultured Paraglaciecola sp.]|uniref:hypothetical protein n=1 Tax=uncultured Paraglaciecola sp. TaxID=1765024 RepID=UPI002603C62F|nr:hypothetical protein [uncultured Paraglaciecola sp.]